VQPIGKFHYQAEVGHGLVENELDYVLVGYWDRDLPFVLNGEEIEDCKWVDLFDLQGDLCENSGRYTAWLKQVMLLAQEFIQ
jgi:isopentenyl-diphosphate Delta-isomerase